VAPPCEWKGNWTILLFASFGLENLPQLNTKAVHNLKTKSSDIILTQSRDGEECARFCRFCPVLAVFGHILPQLKKLFPEI